MAKLTRLGELERAVMDHLWSTREPQTVRQSTRHSPPSATSPTQRS